MPLAEFGLAIAKNAHLIVAPSISILIRFGNIIDLPPELSVRDGIRDHIRPSDLDRHGRMSNRGPYLARHPPGQL